MRVLFISHNDGKYGAPRSLMGLLSEFIKDKRVTPIVITGSYNEVNIFCEKNQIENYVTYHYLSVYGKSEKFSGALKDSLKFLRYFFRNQIALHIIKSKIDIENIDIIHTNTSSMDIGNILAKKYKIKHIIHLREFGKQDFNLSAFRKNNSVFLNSTTSYFIAISQKIKDTWITQGIEKDKIKVIYNGIDIKNQPVRQNDRRKILKIIMVGSINIAKGQNQLIEAVGLLPREIKNNIRISIFGGGDFQDIENLKVRIKQLNIVNIVEFKGYSNNIKEVLGQYDIGINCSRAEGFGRTTVEYMASELAVIASDRGANKEIIDDNINGLIYKFDKYEDLAIKIKWLYDNPEIIISLGKKAHEKVVSQFTAVSNATKIFELYEELLYREEGDIVEQACK